MVIQHNISSLNSWRNTRINNNSASKNLEKLSSGIKINRAADDAAGLAISEKMRGQIRGLGMAEQNTTHAINLIQTAEGGLNETHALLQRMRELAVQSANGTYHDDVDRENLNKEYIALMDEVTRISQSTHYNGIKLLNGSVLSDASVNVPASAKLVPPSTSDLATYTISPDGNHVTIWSDGAFDISNMSISGDCTISLHGTAENVRLIQSDGIQRELHIDVNNTYTNLFLDGINAIDTQGKSIISTSFAGEFDNLTINLIGTNNFERNILTPPYGYQAEPLIGFAFGESTCSLTINEAAGYAGTLNISENALENFDAALIGGTGNITIAGGTINISRTGDSSFSSPLIGITSSGNSASIFIDNPPSITILGATINASIETDHEWGNYSPVIGTTSEFQFGVMPSINIYGGNINASVTAERNNAAIIGSSGWWTTGRMEINIHGGALSLDNSGVDLVLAAAIGAGMNSNNGADITIYDSDISLIGCEVEQTDPNTGEIVKTYGSIGNSAYTEHYLGPIDNPPFDDYYNNQLLSNCGWNPSVVIVHGTSDITGNDVNGIFIKAHPLTFQVGANGSGDQKISLTIPSMSANRLGISNSNITSQEEANDALRVLDMAIADVSTVRANLGSVQNRLEHTISSLGVSKENLQAAESSIRDVDMAKEMMEFTKNNILAQAAQSMLAQANQLPQGVLSLLRAS